MKCEECGKAEATKKKIWPGCGFCGGTECNDYDEITYLCDSCAVQYPNAVPIDEEK